MKRKFKYLFSFLFTLVFLFLAFKDISLNELISSFKNVNIFWLAIFIFVGLASHLLRAWRWKILLSAFKENISIKNTFGSVMIGYLINTAVPRLGELGRAFILAKNEKLTTAATFGTVITERLLDLAFFILFIFTAILLLPSHFEKILPSIEQNKLLLNSIAILVLIKVLLIIFYPQLIRKIGNIIFKPLPKKISLPLEKLMEGVLSFHKIKNNTSKLIVIIQTVLIILLYTLSFEIAFKIFPNMNLENLGFEVAIVLMVASGVAFTLPAPSGFGTYHSFITYILATNYLIEKPIALSYAVATHELGIILTAVIGCYYFFKFNISIKELKNNEAISN